MNIFYAHDVTNLSLRINRADIRVLGDPRYLYVGYNDHEGMFYVCAEPVEEKANTVLSASFYRHRLQDSSTDGITIRIDSRFANEMKRLNLAPGKDYLVPSVVLPIDVDGKEEPAVYYSFIDATEYTGNHDFDEEPELPPGVFQDMNLEYELYQLLLNQ